MSNEQIDFYISDPYYKALVQKVLNASGLLNGVAIAHRVEAIDIYNDINEILGPLKEVPKNITYVLADSSTTKYVGTLKDAGIIVYHAVPSLDGAIKAANAGVDGLVVEGTEGGGFKSPVEVGLLVLIQSIKQNLDLPIIAAGGIVDGSGMAAVFAAGAEGIQMGTRFVSSIESPVHDNFKNKIIDSGIDGTYILNKKSKPVIRALKTDLTKDIDEKGEMDMTALMNIQDLYFGGDMEAAPALSGQSTGLIDQVKPVKQIIDETIEEFNQICKKLGTFKF